MYSGVTISTPCRAPIIRFEIERMLGHAGFALQVAVIDRQRKIGERNPGDVTPACGQFNDASATGFALCEQCATSLE